METQEFGEMMEHVDEVNFALDGLRSGQPARIRRSSLLSLLTICGTLQQRRFLRTQGMTKKIIDAVLGLSFDDSPSILAASAVLFVLASDAQDDHLLESPSCIQFLIRLLNPPIYHSDQAKVATIGSRLLGIHKSNTGASSTPPNRVDSSSSAIKSKVYNILSGCKEIKHPKGDDEIMERPELTSKWIVLLTMEKACLSIVSFDDTSGATRNFGGNFKQRLRELGGLVAVFNVAASCHSKMEGWMDCSLPSIWDLTDGIAFEGVILLLKCLKIMENATFLSKENQNHLLDMCTELKNGRQISCVGLIISSIKIISGLSLLQKSSHGSNGQRPNDLCDNISILPRPASGFQTNGACKENCNKNISSGLSGCFPNQQTPYVKNSEACQKRQKISFPTSESPKSSEANNKIGMPCSTKKKEIPSGLASCNKKIGCLVGDLFLNSSPKSNSIRTSNQWLSINGNGPKASKLGNSNGIINANGSKNSLTFPRKRSLASEDSKNAITGDYYDPFEFDEDELGPSKWEVSAISQKTSQSHRCRSQGREFEDKLDKMLKFADTEVTEEDNIQNSSLDLCIPATDKGSNLLEDCLLTAVKVLMNLTNDNPIGCQQIAASGGLDTMASLILNHFPSFEWSSFPTTKIDHKQNENTYNPKNKHLNDHELELLVAILGLLVNLVEKDNKNRSSLASSRFPVPRSGNVAVKGSQRDVISLLCSIFLANQGAGESAELGCDAEAALLQGEREAEMMIIEAYSALLLAFLSTESRSVREAIALCLPNENLKILVPVLERFVEFHLSLNMISSETHTIVSEVIESCRIP